MPANPEQEPKAPKQTRGSAGQASGGQDGDGCRPGAARRSAVDLLGKFAMSYVPPVDQLASQLGSIFKYVMVRNAQELDRVCAMLAERSLWFWHVTGQNDERECQPEVFFDGGYHERYQYFRDDFKSAYPHADLRGIKRQAKRAAMNPRIPRPEQVYRYWAICCFSASRDCAYMWEQYGADGAGIMVEYPTPEGSSSGLASKVNYTDDPVRLDLLRLDESAVYRVFTTKAKQWSRENEYRLVERLKEPFSGRSFRYSDLRIASVTIGVRLQSTFVKRIREVCREASIDVCDSKQPGGSDREQ